MSTVQGRVKIYIQVFHNANIEDAKGWITEDQNAGKLNGDTLKGGSLIQDQVYPPHLIPFFGKVCMYATNKAGTLIDTLAAS